MKKTEIDKYFREGLSGFEQSPPESGWDNIAGKLNERRKKRIVLLIFQIAAGMVILLSTGLILHMATRSETETSSFVANSPSPSNSNSTLNHNQAKANEVEVNHRNHTIGTTKKTAVLPETPEVAVLPAYHIDSAQLTSNVAPHVNIAPLLALKQNISGHIAVNQAAVLAEDINPEPALTDEQIIALLTSEDNTVEEPVKSGNEWLLGSEIAPLYSYRNISAESAQSDLITNLNDNEAGVVAYAGGLSIAFTTGKRFSIQSGIYYSRYGQEKNHVNATFKSSVAKNSFQNTEQVLRVANSTGTINSNVQQNDVTDLAIASEYGSTVNGMDFAYQTMASQASTGSQEVVLKQYFDYFELPLIARYKLIDRKIDFSLSGGLITNFLVGNSVKMVQNGKTSDIGETNDINEINYQGSFGIGIAYPVLSNFDITLEPRFRYYLNPIGESSSAIEVHPYSFGFFAGFNFRF